MFPARILVLAVGTLMCVRSAHAFEISEILVRNEGGIRDADADSPGWIEIHNESTGPQSLAGWHLTDDPALPTKWAFPGTVVPAGGYLIVFASGKDRAVAGQELHTSFELDPDGEYLALVAPGGMRPSEYNPFPSVRRNISFAVTEASVVIPLVTESTPVRYHIPTDGSLGETWTGAAFDHSGWAQGPFGLGFDAAGGGGTVLAIDVNDRDNNVTALLQAGFQPFVIGSTGGSTLVQTGSIVRTFGPYSVTLSNSGLDGYDDRLRTTPTDSGAFTEASLFRDFVFSRDSTGASGLDLTIAGLPPNTPVRVTIWSYDSLSSGTRVSDWSCNGAVVQENYTFDGSALPTTNGQYQFGFNAASNGSGQLVIQGRRDATSSTFGVFLNAFRVESLSLAPLIATNVGAAMHNVNSSLYARLPISVPDPTSITSLRLRVNHDDGWAAWVNGTRLTLRNAPDPPAWNSAATTPRTQSEVFAEEVVDLPVAGLLGAGPNVLALQGLNVSAADDDFLIRAQVDAIGQTAQQPHYFASPTPGAANGLASVGVVSDTHFSVNRGYFSAPFATAITCDTPQTEIRFTTDGSAPTATTGIVYSAPIIITSSTVLRAAAFRNGWIPSNVDAQTYIFPAQVAQQPADPAGWPATWGIDSEVNGADGAGDGTVPSDYEMDPEVVNNTVAGHGIPEALNALPVLSLSLAPQDFLGPSGIYQNPRATGTQWERPCAIEFFDPSGAAAESQETCAVEIHGNSSRRPFRMQKHSFRLSFRGNLGAAKWRYPLFPGSPVDEFNKLVLRACFTDSWGLVSWDPNRYRPDDSVYFRDVWMKRSHAAMGHLESTNRFAHLFINGLYWGVYNVSERVEEDFFADHIGGRPEDWDVIDWEDTGSHTSHWTNMFAVANAGLSTPSAYQEVQQYVDPVSFADYYLLHVLADAEDWPHKNGYAARNRTILTDRYRWLVWDQEIMLDNHSINRVAVGAGNTGTDRTAGRLYQKLRENAEFRLLFADRAHRLFHNSGALSLPANQARWQELADGLDVPIVAESARWGDTADETPYGTTASKPLYTREADWLPTVASVRNVYLPSLYNNVNTYATIRKLQSAGVYPTTAPPDFAQYGGIVQPGFSLAISAAAGTIYFTVDGTDPREAVTGAALGTVYSGAITLNETATVKARVRNGVEWSALTQSTFIVGTAASAANLVISEIYYHPLGDGELEFIELMNIGTTDIDLTGVRFTAGIACQIPDATTLAPGERLVLMEGDFTGKLDNNGEELVLIAADDSEIARFRYNDAAPWPSAADLGGHSLVLVAPDSNPDPALPENWRPSAAVGGSPGTGDATTFTGDPQADADGDGQPAIVEYALGTSDADATSFSQPRGALEDVAEEDAAPGKFLVITVPRAPAADDAEVLAQVSNDLGTWESAWLVSREMGIDGRLEDKWRAPLPAVAARQFIRLRIVPRP